MHDSQGFQDQRRWALFLLSALAVPLIVIGWQTAFTSLPPIWQPPPRPPVGSYQTWVGQGVAAAYSWGAILILGAYLVKAAFVRWSGSKVVSAYCYCLLVAASLPY